MSISLAEGRENCSQILVGIYLIENRKKKKNRNESLVLTVSFIKKILYTELKETDFIK